MCCEASCTEISTHPATVNWAQIHHRLPAPSFRARHCNEIINVTDAVSDSMGGMPPGKGRRIVQQAFGVIEVERVSIKWGEQSTVMMRVGGSARLSHFD